MYSLTPGHNLHEAHIGRGLPEVNGAGAEASLGDTVPRRNPLIVDEDPTAIDRCVGRTKEGIKDTAEEPNKTAPEDHLDTKTTPKELIGYRVAPAPRGEGSLGKASDVDFKAEGNKFKEAKVPDDILEVKKIVDTPNKAAAKIHETAKDYLANPKRTEEG